MNTYWISKYALTNGVEQKRGEPAISSKEYVTTSGGGFYRLGKDVHETPEAAAKTAEKMRVRKITSLKKQIARLEGLRFEVQE